MSIYIHDNADKDRRAATVADRSQSVCAGHQAAQITFPREDTREINVANRHSIYRSIWETGRKHDLDDDTIQRIVAMYAYDLDLNRRLPRRFIEILQIASTTGHQDLLCRPAPGRDPGKNCSASAAMTARSISSIPTSGESGSLPLTRRPLQGSGVDTLELWLARAPIFRKSILHTGVDLAVRHPDLCGWRWRGGKNRLDQRLRQVRDDPNVQRLRNRLWPYEPHRRHRSRALCAAGARSSACRLDRQLHRPAPPASKSSSATLRRPAERKNSPATSRCRPSSAAIRPDRRPDPRPDDRDAAPITVASN